MSSNTERTDIAGIRKRLEGLSGQRYWRSLEEAAQSPEFLEILQREFPAGATEWADGVGRRNFLKLMGASLALAGITACTRQPEETLAPYADAPEGYVPGQPRHYATALTLGGVASGALVETHEGRPTKIEGNPDHPSCLGASDAFMQASVLGLYDPDRSRTLNFRGEIHAWADLTQTLADVVKVQELSRGAGLRILTGAVTSPTLAHQIQMIQQRFPEARWHQYEPVHTDNSLEGSRLAFGEPVAVRHYLDRAQVILSLDADFVFPSPGSLRNIREYSLGRKVGDGQRTMNRLYVAESTPSNTGAIADHRLPLASRDIEILAREVAARIGLPVRRAETLPPGLAPHARWIEAVAKDLERAGGAALVMAGETQPPIVHALAHAINDRLGASGTTVEYLEPVLARPESMAGSLEALAADMETGKVNLLLILGANPVYDAPADLAFAARMENVGLRIHMGLYDDETAELCHWHVPQAHELESWSDARSDDGAVTILQPMIAPLYGGRTPHELLAYLHDKPGRSSYDLVRDYWTQTMREGQDFEKWWRRSLHEGIVQGTASSHRDVTLRDGWMDRPVTALDEPEAIEALFRPDASVYDGRFANLGWLQELPRPVTRLTWDNAALVSPALAEERGLSNGDVVELSSPETGETVVEAPVWITPGQATRSVTLHLGYGRRRTGRVGEATGFDAYALRTSSTPWTLSGMRMAPTGRRRELACTQDHHSMEGRHLVRSASLEHYLEEPDFARHMVHEPARDMTIYKNFEYEGHAWGMTIDLNSCVGCNACVIGCQAENNIPVVGKDQVAVGREMHWIRVDRYFEGDLDNPGIVHQPVNCMQCEQAPCEPVCPVGATVHSSEGLNEMVYNRCVGTRYCSNNCPYKVRRFNFLLYSDFENPTIKMQKNPDVTVRSRGVMEKCTYCVQRINAARIEAQKEDRPIRDGEIRTACQQACPAQAISFGDINDEQSRVARLKADPRNYSLLGDINTRPRTTYLAAVRNPNPELEEH